MITKGLFSVQYCDMKPNLRQIYKSLLAHFVIACCLLVQFRSSAFAALACEADLDPHAVRLTQAQLSLLPGLRIYSLLKGFRNEEISFAQAPEYSHLPNAENRRMTYLEDEDEQNAHLLRVVEGKFYEGSSRIFCVVPCTKIVAMNSRGFFYIITPKDKKIHHSSLVNGLSVLYAGDSVFFGNSMQRTDFESGHYYPKMESIWLYLAALHQARANLPKKIHIVEAFDENKLNIYPLVSSFLNPQLQTEIQRRMPYLNENFWRYLRIFQEQSLLPVTADPSVEGIPQP